MAKMITPAISLPVPNFGLFPPLDKSDTAGEFRKTTGRAVCNQHHSVVGSTPGGILRIQTTQTQRIWNPQNPANLKKCDLISSNLVSPILSAKDEVVQEQGWIEGVRRSELKLTSGLEDSEQEETG